MWCIWATAVPACTTPCGDKVQQTVCLASQSQCPVCCCHTMPQAAAAPCPVSATTHVPLASVSQPLLQTLLPCWLLLVGMSAVCPSIR
jgi:hypothetical protein